MANVIQIDRLPARLLHTGRIVIIIALGILLLTLLQLETKELLRGNIVITTEQIPSDVTSKRSGYFAPLITEETNVQSEQLIGYIKEDFELEQVLQLKRILAKTDLDALTAPGKTSLSDSLIGMWNLGTLYPAYKAFATAYLEYHLLQTVGNQQRNQLLANNAQQIGILNQQLRYLQSVDSVLQEKEKILKNITDRERALLEDKVIAPANLETVQAAAIDEALKNLNNKLNREKLHIEMASLARESTAVTGDYQELERQRREALLLQLQNLKNALRSWEEQYLIKAPIGGRCYFKTFEVQAQRTTWVNDKETVARIVPTDTARVVGLLQLTLEGTSKLTLGQRVRIKLRNYPYLESGALFGKVKQIAKIPFDGKYKVLIEFPNGLQTNYSNQLSYMEAMEGEAEVIIEESNLFRKIKNSIRWNLSE